MSILDLIIIAIIVYSGARAYYKGFLYTAFQTVSTVLSLVLAYVVYKPINLILRKTFLYDSLQKIVMGKMVDGQNPVGLQAQAQLINGSDLPIPGNIKEHLVQNNNPEVYKLLGVSSFQEYIGGYIANFLISVIAFVIVLCLVKAIISIVARSIQTISRLPLINFADKWLGLGLGFIKGLIGVWIATIVMAVLILLPKFQTLAVMLNESTLGKWFYENNIVLELIDQLFV